jgi:hypothetical protein
MRVTAWTLASYRDRFSATRMRAFDVELLADLLAEFAGDKTRHHVDDAARRERHDHAHRAGREALRQAVPRQQQGRGHGSGNPGNPGNPGKVKQATAVHDVRTPRTGGGGARQG